MLKKLRIRVTIICMSILTVIFICILSVMHTLNFKQVNVYADNILEILAMNGGRFDDSFKPDIEPGFSPEVKYETRFFYVVFDGDDNVRQVNVKNIASVTTDEAIEMATNALDGDDERGYEDSYQS